MSEITAGGRKAADFKLSQLWRDERYRGVASQVIVVVGVIAAILWIIGNTRKNLAERGLDVGFAFLRDPAGIDIGVRLIEYASTDTWGRAMTVGLLNTLLVSAMGIVAATIIGFTAGIVRLSPNWLLRTIVATWVELTRNVPLLLQIIFWWVVLLGLPRVRDSLSIGDSIFLNNRGLTSPAAVFNDGSSIVLIALGIGVIGAYAVLRWAKARQAATGEPFPAGWTALAIIIGLPVVVYFVAGRAIALDVPVSGTFNLQGGFTVTPELVALWFALSTYTASFISEIVRAGILAVHRGQTEAAGALGLSRWQTTRLIVVPQALRVIIPPLTSQYLNLTKNSSLALAVGFQDFVAIGSQAQNQTGQAIEIVFSWMVVYLSLSLLTSAFMNWYNAHIALVER